MKKVILLSVSILLISLAYAFADVPCKINYQGRLIKDNVPVDGTKTMRFSIHDSAVGGTQLWTSGDVSVEVHNGLFRYVIGSDGGDLSSINWTAGETLYLEVKVETDILTPREELYAYPYAINSHLLEGEAKEYFINTSGDSQTKQGNLNIMGNVGIGTASPVVKLHIDGPENEKILKLTPNFGFDYDTILTITEVGAGSLVSVPIWHGSGPPYHLLYNVGNTFTFLDTWITDLDYSKTYFNGNVGIGTTNPGTNKLEVVGGPIKATGGLIIETRTTDPTTPATGQTWLRTDF